MLPKSIKNLIDKFTKFPSVGPRQAARFVYCLLEKPKEEIEDFAMAILNLQKIKKCALCYQNIEKSEKEQFPYLCPICKNDKRNKTTICIVEKDTDIEIIEKTGRYNGLYHILGKSEIKNFNEKILQELHLKELIKRIKDNKEIKEVIIATSATTNGDTLALYISRLLKPLNIKKTRLGRGLSTGSELEYMDEETLSQALLGRK